MSLCHSHTNSCVGHLVTSWWCSLEKLNLYNVKHCWRKWITAGRVLRFQSPALLPVHSLLSDYMLWTSPTMLECIPWNCKPALSGICLSRRQLIQYLSLEYLSLHNMCAFFFFSRDQEKTRIILYQICKGSILILYSNNKSQTQWFLKTICKEIMSRNLRVYVS